MLVNVIFEQHVLSKKKKNLEKSLPEMCDIWAMYISVFMTTDFLIDFS